jgi:hypothetical protein
MRFMYSINMYESSMYKNSALSTAFKLNFQTNINEATIILENPFIEDVHNRIRNVLDIKIEIISLHTSLRKTLGQVKTSLWAFNKTTPNYNKWEWILDSNDIASIENIRYGDISFYVDVKAILLVDKENSIIPIYGQGQIRFSESDWLTFISNFGYSTKYASSIPSVLLEDNSWINAYRQLDIAREHMHRGKTYDALRQCLSVIESYKDSDKYGGPYSDKVWEELLQDMIPQKQEGIKGLLSGVSTYLNKIGHHRNIKRSENGNLETIPLNQYEAEIMLSITQLVVTYIERIRNDGNN